MKVHIEVMPLVIDLWKLEERLTTPGEMDDLGYTQEEKDGLLKVVEATKMIDGDKDMTVGQVLMEVKLTYHEFKRWVRRFAELVDGNRSRMYPIMNDEELDTAINKMPTDIEALIESKDLRKSGLVLVGIDPIVVNFNRYTPSTGSSYIDLPAEIKNKKKSVY